MTSYKGGNSKLREQLQCCNRESYFVKYNALNVLFENLLTFEFDTFDNWVYRTIVLPSCEEKALTDPSAFLFQ